MLEGWQTPLHGLTPTLDWPDISFGPGGLLLVGSDHPVYGTPGARCLRRRAGGYLVCGFATKIRRIVRVFCCRREAKRHGARNGSKRGRKSGYHHGSPPGRLPSGVNFFFPPMVTR